MVKKYTVNVTTENLGTPLAMQTETTVSDLSVMWLVPDNFVREM